MNNDTQQALELLRRGGGYLTARAAAAAGVPGITLTRLLRRGVVERPQRGVYRLVAHKGGQDISAEAEDLLEVQLRSPMARPCLASALHLHGLTTTRPTRLQVAVPRGSRRPQLDYPMVEVFLFGPTAYDTGQVDLPVGPRTLGTYTPEKTLVDLLRYAPRLGRALYLEGLGRYLWRPGAQVQLLLDLGRALGVGRTLAHDLEVLLHDR